MASSCSICTRDCVDGFVCGACLTRLSTDLLTLAWLTGEVRVTRTRQARLAGGSGKRSRGDGSPIPFHEGAARLADELHNDFVGWVRDLHRPADPWPADTAPSMARWLVERADRIRQHPAADEFATDVERLTRRALETINVPPAMSYGLCGALTQDSATCEAYLHGEPDATWVRCRGCGTQHDTARRKLDLRQRMENLYLRASTLARLLPRLIERPVSASNVRNWSRDGRPIRTLVDDDGYTTYRVGDVITVALATPVRKRGSAA